MSDGKENEKVQETSRKKKYQVSFSNKEQKNEEESIGGRRRKTESLEPQLERNDETNEENPLDQPSNGTNENGQDNAVEANNTTSNQAEKDKKLNLATCNLQGMAGKENILVDLFIKHKIHVLALQETNYNNTTKKAKVGDHVFYNSGQEGVHKLGTGFLVHKNLENLIIEFRPISERMCFIQLRGNNNKNISLINIHAPSEKKNKAKSFEEKIEFYENLEELYLKIPTSDIKIILGDANAQIGKEEFYQPTIGKLSKHNKTNCNGELLIKFAMENNMRIRSTFFKSEGTWIVPGTDQINQLDHVLIGNEHAKFITLVQSHVNIPVRFSDHFLVTINTDYNILTRNEEIYIDTNKSRPNHSSVKDHTTNIISKGDSTEDQILIQNEKKEMIVFKKKVQKVVNKIKNENNKKENIENPKPEECPRTDALNTIIYLLEANKQVKYQCRFTTTRLEQIFALKEIQINFFKQNLNLSLLFIYFKIVDSELYTTNVITLLKKKFTSVPQELIDFLQQHTIVKGDPLSTMLISLVLEFILKENKRNTTGHIYTQTYQWLAYGYKPILITTTEDEMKSIMKNLIVKAKEVGLSIDQDMTKYMKMKQKTPENINSIDGLQICIDNTGNRYQFVKVKSFNYLGARITWDCNTSEEICASIAKGSRCFGFYSDYMRNNNMTPLTPDQKMIIYEEVIKPSVLAMCSTWILSRTNARKLRSWDMKNLRRIYGEIEEEGELRKGTYSELRTLSNKPGVISIFRKQRIRLLGNIERLPDESITKRSLIKATKQKSNLKKSNWLRDIEEDLKDIEIYDWKSSVQDRIKWGKIVEEAEYLQ